MWPYLLKHKMFVVYCDIPSHSGDRTHDLVFARQTCLAASLKVCTSGQVASGSPAEVTGGYDSPPQQVKTSSRSYSDKEIMHHPHCPMSTNWR